MWGKAAPSAPAGGPAQDAPAPVSRARVVAALAVVGGVTWILVAVAGLGPSWKAVATAALGSAVAVRVAGAAHRVAVVTVLVVGVSGLGWIELINKAQYGTLALTGAPPLVRWCGTTFRPSGVIATAPSTGGGSAYSKILRTPSGYDVYGVALLRSRACGTSGPLFVHVGEGRYAAYDS
jgi:hypothetical protein